MNKEDKEVARREIYKYFLDLKFRISIYDKAKKEMDTYLASYFNVFNYINPNENKLSDIFADFLNPKGNHGQNDMFLKEFVNILGIDLDYDLSCCKVGRENSTSYIQNNKRRIDIVLNFKNEFEIGIENKPWDTDQENQLQDYHEHLSKKYDDNFCMVYISGDGSQPISIDDDLKDKLNEEKKLIVLTYEVEINNWLKSCYKECKSEKIRIFIKDFIEFIENNFENLYDDMGE